MEVDCPERVGLKRRGCVGFVSRDNLNSPFGSVLAPRQNSVRKSGWKPPPSPPATVLFPFLLFYLRRLLPLYLSICFNLFEKLWPRARQHHYTAKVTTTLDTPPVLPQIREWAGLTGKNRLFRPHTLIAGACCTIFSDVSAMTSKFRWETPRIDKSLLWTLTDLFQLRLNQYTIFVPEELSEARVFHCNLSGRV